MCSVLPTGNATAMPPNQTNIAWSKPLVLTKHFGLEMESQNKISASPISRFHSSDSVFAHLAQAPEDVVLGVTVPYNKDPSPVKLNLGVGAYRTKIEGKPIVLNVVRKTEQKLVNDLSCNKEYLPITGLAEFNKLSAKLIFCADSPAIQENRVTTVHGLSGTGSLRVGGEFLAKHHHQRTIYIPQPTWGNHTKVFTFAGISVKSYRYYERKEAKGHLKEWKLHINEIPKASRKKLGSSSLLLFASGYEAGSKSS